MSLCWIEEYYFLNWRDILSWMTSFLCLISLYRWNISNYQCSIDDSGVWDIIVGISVVVKDDGESMVLLLNLKVGNLESTIVPCVSFGGGKSILELVLTFFVYILNPLAKTSITEGESSLGLFMIFSLGRGVFEAALESTCSSATYIVFSTQM